MLDLDEATHGRGAFVCGGGVFLGEKNMCKGPEAEANLRT